MTTNWIYPLIKVESNKLEIGYHKEKLLSDALLNPFQVLENIYCVSYPVLFYIQKKP